MKAARFLASLATVVLIASMAHAGAGPRYRLTLLQNPADGTNTRATGISDAGHIVGDAHFSTEFGTLPNGLLWPAANQAPILVQGRGAEFSLARDVNSAGTVVGSMGEGFAGFSWTAGTDLVPLDPFICCGDAHRISNRGVIAGFAPLAGGCGRRATLWDDFGPHALPNLPGECFCSAHDVSDAGFVAGWCGDGPVVWVQGVPTAIPTVGVFAHVASGVNSRGEVVGYGIHSWPIGAAISFHWQAGVQTILPTLGSVQTYAEAINEDGIIVGMSEIPITMFQGSARAAAWFGGQVVDLNTRVVNPVPGITLSHAYDINAGGSIVGVALRGSDLRGFVLQPLSAADLDTDGDVDGLDLASLLASWGRCTGACPADFDGNGVVNGLDLASLLAAWIGG